MTGFTVVNPRTIRIVLIGRYAFFVDQILGATKYILPKHALVNVDVARILEHPYARPPATSWGNIVADGRVYLRTAWWVSLFPGLFAFLAVMAFTLLGDGLRDAFDPRMKV